MGFSRVPIYSALTTIEQALCWSFSSKQLLNGDYRQGYVVIKGVKTHKLLGIC